MLSKSRECNGSVVECLSRDQEAAVSSLASITGLCLEQKHIDPCLVLVNPGRLAQRYLKYVDRDVHYQFKQTNKQTI